MSHVVQYEIDPQLTKQLESLKVAFMHHPNSSVETRISLLKKIRAQLVEAEHDFIAASNKTLEIAARLIHKWRILCQ